MMHSSDLFTSLRPSLQSLPTGATRLWLSLCISSKSFRPCPLLSTMSTDSHTMAYRVHPTPPPTHNVLTADQKAQLRRSNTKLTRVLGSAPQVIDKGACSSTVDYQYCDTVILTSLIAVPRPMSPLEKKPQPSLSISSGRSSSSHRRTRSADPDAFPLSASPRPASREGSVRARQFVDAQQHGHQQRSDSAYEPSYEPSFAIPTESKVKRDKLARVCKILGRDVPSNVVFPHPPTYEESEMADRKAAQKVAQRSYTPMFPEDCVNDVRTQQPANPGPTYAFPEDYLPHIRAERDRQAAEKKAAEKKKAGRRSYMPMFPEECGAPEPAPAVRAPTFTFPEDYLPYIHAQAEAEQQSRRYHSPLETITELKSSSRSRPRASSSSDSSSSPSTPNSDDDSLRFSYLSSTTSSTYRAHPSAFGGEGPYSRPQYDNAKTVGRKDTKMFMPFRRRAGGLSPRPEEKAGFDIVQGMRNLDM